MSACQRVSESASQRVSELRFAVSASWLEREVKLREDASVGIRTRKR